MPHEITGLEFGEELPETSVVFIDEAAMALYAREHMKGLNKLMNVLLSVSRQRDQTLIFASHTARKLDVGIVMDMDAIIFREPSRLYARLERREIREMADRSLKEFQDMDGDARLESSVVWSHDLDGEVVKNPLPSFWREKFQGAGPEFLPEKGKRSMKRRGKSFRTF